MGAEPSRLPWGACRRVVRAARRWRDLLVEPVLSVLFPPRCVGCGDFETHLCEPCRGSLLTVGDDCCPCCGEPGPRPLVAGRCSQCMGADPAFASVRSAFRHRGVARRLVTEFKFGGQPVLGQVMADLARPVFADYVSSIGRRDRIVVTWVPTHGAVQRTRGYNQAELLARTLAGGGQPMVLAGLSRKQVATRHQKGLGRAGRQANLRGVFTMDERAVARLPSQCEALLLVDDVYTTGATAREVSSVLTAGTGLPVHVFTFSRAVSGSAEKHD